MKCPKCNKKAKASATKFIEYSHAQRRIRTCECGFKFITYERIEVDKQDFGQHSKEKKKEYYRKVLKELIDDLEGRTYLEKGKRLYYLGGGINPIIKKLNKKMLLLIGLLITLGVVGVLILMRIYNPPLIYFSFLAVLLSFLNIYCFNFLSKS